jgi:dTDP-glucose 4,6-dehydratase
VKKNILVIGSAGFVGANLIRYITYNSNNYNIISLDKLQDTSSIHNVYLNKNNDFYLADVTNENILDRIFKINNINIIINLASDLNGIYNLHRLSVKYNIEKFITLSYPFYCNDTNESSPITSNNIYTHEEFSSYCIDNYITSKLFFPNYNILRIPKCFGPRQQIDNVIPNLFYSLIKHEKVLLPNKGLDIHDLLYIEDLCSAILLILEKGVNNEIYNVSINLDYTELELAVIIRDILLDAKTNNKIDYSIGELALDDIIDSNTQLNIDCSKIKALGWKPNRKFRENIKYTINWYITNKWFFNL